MLYEVTGTGDLAAVDAATGKVLWKKKVGYRAASEHALLRRTACLYVGMYVTIRGTPLRPPQADADGVANGDLIVLQPRA
jgi:glucose dehydrogenase